MSFYVTTTHEWEFLLLHILFSILWCLGFDYSCRYIVLSYCFNLYFPDDMWHGVYFHILIFHLQIFFDEVSVKVFDPFLNWAVRFLCWVLRVLRVFWTEVNPLSDVSFVNILSLPVACLLIFSMDIFTWQIFSAKYCDCEMVKKEKNILLVYFSGIYICLWVRLQLFKLSKMKLWFSYWEM